MTETASYSPATPASRTPLLVLAVSLLLMLVGSMAAGYLQSSAVNSTVTSVSFYSTNKAAYTAYLWVPNGVDENHQAPGILSLHGFNNSKEYMTNTSMELARRGYVVLNMDLDDHGQSGTSTLGGLTIPSPNGIGAIDGLEYLRSLPIVDTKNIGMIGMSLGGYAIDFAAAAKPNDYKSMFFMDSLCILTCDTAKNFALSDGEQTEIVNAPALKGADMISNPAFMKGFGTTQPIVPGKVYGDIAAGTARIFYFHWGNHSISTDDPTTIGNAITWFGMTLAGGNSGIPSSDQIWPLKVLSTGLAFLGFALFLFAFGALLLRTSFFRSLNEKTPEYKGNVGLRYWAFAVFTAALAPVLFQLVFPTSFKSNWFQLQSVTTGFATWLAVTGVITVAVLLAGHYLWGRKAGATALHYGLTWPGAGFDWRRIAKSLALALVVVGAGYFTVFLATAWFKVDFRFYLITLKTTDIRHLLIMLAYVIPIALYFVPLAVALHGTLRPNNGQVTVAREMVTNIAMLLIGVLVYLAIFYVPITFMGGIPAGVGVGNGGVPVVLGMINFIGLIVLIPIVAGLSTFFFRMTGHVYVGAFICTLFITWYLVAANTTYSIASLV